MTNTIFQSQYTYPWQADGWCRYWLKLSKETVVTLHINIGAKDNVYFTRVSAVCIIHVIITFTTRHSSPRWGNVSLFSLLTNVWSWSTSPPKPPVGNIQERHQKVCDRKQEAMNPACVNKSMLLMWLSFITSYNDRKLTQQRLLVMLPYGAVLQPIHVKWSGNNKFAFSSPYKWSLPGTIHHGAYQRPCIFT